MRRYDTTFIINSQIGDDSIDASVKEIANLITSDKGSVLREQRIGNRRLAYEITRQTHGYYVCLIHECETGTLTKLDRHFDLGANYLRHLTVRFDGDPFRKTITEIMMGFESEKRGPGEKSVGGAKPESSGVKTAPAEPKAPAAASPAPQPEPKAPAAKPETESSAPAPVESTESEAETVTEDESTL